MDLTKITTPFGLLDPETQEALKAHGGPYEFFDGGDWVSTSRCDDTPTLAHRVKPQPLTKPSIDWSHVAPEYNWLARDMSGDTYFYAGMPEKHAEMWRYAGKHRIADVFASFTPGTCDWRDSLVERPE